MWWSKSLCWNHLPIAFGLITICQNTFPLNLPLFCNGKVFWWIENAGNVAKRPLKTPSHCKKFTKMPQNSLKTMPKAWKRGPPSPSPMCDHFSEALVDFTMQNWGEIGQKLKRLISLFDQMQGKGVLTNLYWYDVKIVLQIKITSIGYLESWVANVEGGILLWVSWRNDGHLVKTVVDVGPGVPHWKIQPSFLHLFQ